MIKLFTKISIIFMTCCFLVLLTGCGTNTTVGTQPPSASTAIAQGTPTSPVATPTQATTSAPTSTASNFPACKPFSSVNLDAVSTPASNAVFYVSSQGGVQTMTKGSVLKRYDLASGKTTPLLNFSGSAASILSGQLSPDKRWLALIASAGDGHPNALLLIGTDGTHLHNLDCNANGGLPVWSSDGNQIAFASLAQGSATTIRIVNLIAGTVKVVVQGSYQPLAWADGTHLLITSQLAGILTTASATVSLIDTTKDSSQQPQTIASAPSICNSFVISPDGQKLYSATCSLGSVNNCRSNNGFQGTGAIKDQSSLGGSATTLYSNANLGVMAIQPVGSNILFYRANGNGETDQGGLWILHADGSVSHLTSDNSQSCLNIEGSNLLPTLASNGTAYAFYNGETSQLPLTITVGNLTSNSTTTIASMNAGDGILTLVGMA